VLEGASCRESCGFNAGSENVGGFGKRCLPVAVSSAAQIIHAEESKQSAEHDAAHVLET
jgi:hypothetical protein